MKTCIFTLKLWGSCWYLFSFPDEVMCVRCEVHRALQPSRLAHSTGWPLSCTLLTKGRPTCAGCCCNTERTWTAMSTSTGTRPWCSPDCQVPRVDHLSRMIKILFLCCSGKSLRGCVVTCPPLCLQGRPTSRGWCWTRGRKRTWSTLSGGPPHKWLPLSVRMWSVLTHTASLKVVSVNTSYTQRRGTPLYADVALPRPQHVTFSCDLFMFLLPVSVLRATRLRHGDKQLLFTRPTRLLHEAAGFGEGAEAAVQTGRAPPQGHHEHQPEPCQGQLIRVFKIYVQIWPFCVPVKLLNEMLYK